MASARHIPSIDALLKRAALADAIAREGQARVTAALRAAADQFRQRPEQIDGDAVARWIEQAALSRLAADAAPSLRRVINATGVILHTNLGRAPLAEVALDRIRDAAAGYANLEYNLDAGARGHRHVHAESRLLALTGAEAALVVNNNAAATMLVLAAHAAGREVIVSRGELVEIGGGFRVPDVMAQSGATLREVGTTNRTRANDYAAAISDRTAMILRVHPSNFRIDGFTERPILGELTALARRFNLPLFEDLGSGWLGVVEAEAVPALRDEPTVIASVRAGADLVAFSGDKLLGGPQAGIVVGRREAIERARKHPLMRALRADKLTYAALDATLALWQQAPARDQIPVYRMLTMTRDDIAARAEALASALKKTPGVITDVTDGVSTIGGGSAPGSALPTALVAIRSDDVPALERTLRCGTPHVISRIEQDAVRLDLRTVDPADDDQLAFALERALTPSPGAVSRKP
ncbi:MAG TPA: L-seryl-tRNA(Sec) selenium transferase [Vicinamibacterales bacterium]|nr:L-seryl-tRNA(Sec) selenium transferase [Vicinamibacterales bacterium]